jgi:hypothetical protein
MRMRREYIPKRNDCVRVKESPGACVILSVNMRKKTVHLSTVTSPVILYYDVRWDGLHCIASGSSRYSSTAADRYRRRAEL